jgi:16S rRNA (guanine966-N2)-methyltransferase
VDRRVRDGTGLCQLAHRRMGRAIWTGGDWVTAAKSGHLRIIAGRLKGRRLTGPPEDGVRPTSDRLRETLFNVIGPSIAGWAVVDAFAGTGAVGLEALSRGAANVVFVERDRRALSVLQSNIDACEAEEACAIIRGDFIGLHSKISARGRADLVFTDPPYEGTDLAAVVAESAHWLNPAGLLILEHSRRREGPTEASGLRRGRVLVAGDSSLSFYAAVDRSAPAVGC